MNAPRLLIIDDAIALGGLERLWKALVPELAKHCETVTWMLPPHRIESFRPAVCNERNVVLESMVWSGWTGGRVRAFGSNRLIRMLDPIRPAWAAILRERAFQTRFKYVVRKFRSSHAILPALFTQAFPKLPIPLFACVADVNYHPSWKRQCEANLRRWASECAGLIAISDFTRGEVERLCPDAHGRIRSIPLAVIRSGQIADAAQPGIARFFYPASFNPHKRHALLLRALRILHDKGMKFELHLTGGGLDGLSSLAPQPYPELEEARRCLSTASADFQKSIVIRGYVSDWELEDEYRWSNCVILPSEYEGFGLPLSEAVVRCRRVVCSDIPAFREQMQLYGLQTCVELVRGDSAETWAEMIRQASAKTPLAPNLVGSRFTRWQWSDVAEHMVDAILTGIAQSRRDENNTTGNPKTYDSRLGAFGDESRGSTGATTNRGATRSE